MVCFFNMLLKHLLFYYFYFFLHGFITIVTGNWIWYFTRDILFFDVFIFKLLKLNFSVWDGLWEIIMYWSWTIFLILRAMSQIQGKKVTQLNLLACFLFHQNIAFDFLRCCIFKYWLCIQHNSSKLIVDWKLRYFTIIVITKEICFPFPQILLPFHQIMSFCFNILFLLNQINNAPNFHLSFQYFTTYLQFKLGDV